MRKLGVERWVAQGHTASSGKNQFFELFSPWCFKYYPNFLIICLKIMASKSFTVMNITAKILEKNTLQCYKKCSSTLVNSISHFRKLSFL